MTPGYPTAPGNHKSQNDGDQHQSKAPISKYVDSVRECLRGGTLGGTALRGTVCIAKIIRIIGASIRAHLMSLLLARRLR